ncbi:MAG: hypothetical protein H0U76_20750 [Ktedonobacteraceae bacterium]|nr:hypothetical protein [Ktedonobacteraceae bacterium]
MPASSFRMMRVRPASGFEDNLSPNFVWRASVGGRTEDRIAVRPLAEDRVAVIGDDRLLCVAALCCRLCSLCFGEESSESCLLLLLMGKKSDKLRKEKVRASEEQFVPLLDSSGWTIVVSDFCAVLP